MIWRIQDFNPLIREVSDGEDAAVEVSLNTSNDLVYVETELGFSFAIPGRVVRNAQSTRASMLAFVDEFVREYEWAVYDWLGRQSYWRYTRVGL